VLVRRCWFAFALLLLAPSQAPAQDALIPGRGSQLTAAKCVICHEIQHITKLRQSRAAWEESMRMMVERGAPLQAGEIKTITDYLATYYGTGPAPPPDLAAAAESESADPVLRLLNASACAGCHALDRQVVGPGFKSVAEKYRGDAGAAARLHQKIREGGQGAWGQVPMPANPQLSDADLKLLVDWVLGQN
jgi:cytochrome c